MATAFTLGHSITLAIASLDVFRVSGAWVEFLIPVTILGTALWGLFHGEGDAKSRRRTYIMAASFGLIHGLGFSSFFRMTRDNTADLVASLFRFNLGGGAGTVDHCRAHVGDGELASGVQRVGRDQQLFVCGGATFLSLVMALERVPW